MKLMQIFEQDYNQYCIDPDNNENIFYNASAKTMSTSMYLKLKFVTFLLAQQVSCFNFV